MTIEQLKEKMPWIDVTEWVEHPNGGGWKHKTARVPDTVNLPHDSTIGYRASIGNEASIGYRTSIGDGASIGNRVKSVLYIQASVRPLTVCCPTDEVQIGCHRHPIAYWLEHYKAIGRKEQYTDARFALTNRRR